MAQPCTWHRIDPAGFEGSRLSGATETRGDTRVVAFEGELNVETSPVARELLLRREDAARDVLVDLTGVTYLDTSGIAGLIEACHSARKRRRALGLVCSDPAILRSLRLVRVDACFVIHPTREDAFAAATR